MRILILGMNYAPESTGIGPYTSEFAEYMVAAGHEVHVVAAPPHFPQWKIWDGYRTGAFRSEEVNGVRVHRTYTYVPAKPRKVLNRLMYDSIFSGSALLRAVLIRRCDLVFAVSPPVQLGLTAWLAAKVHRAPLFFHIQDIASRAAVGTGMVSSSSLLGRIARRVENAAHRSADIIGVICEAFEKYLHGEGVAPGKIVFFPNYIDTRLLQPAPRMGSFRARHGLKAGDFVVMYSGGIAQKQGLETLVGAAAQTPQFKYFIIGEGPAKADLEQKVREAKLSNVTILPLQPKRGLAQQLSAADVLVLTQKQNVTDAVFPSKLLAYMACERPVVASAAEDSETARFITRHAAGLVVSPENPAALAAALVTLAHSTELGPELARNARHAVMSTFEKEVVLGRMNDLLVQHQPSTVQ